MKDTIILVALEEELPKDLLKEFEALSIDNNPHSKNFFSSVKSFWDSVKN